MVGLTDAVGTAVGLSDMVGLTDVVGNGDGAESLQ